MGKMTVSLVVAAANNGVIGNNNEIPWKLKDDMAFFKKLTTDHTVIMGRKTWESLPPNFRPLPNRKNIVITRNDDYQLPSSVLRAKDLRDALQLAEKSYELVNKAMEVFVIGGGEVYKQAIRFADTIYLTEVKTALEGDTYFHIDVPSNWTVMERQYGHQNTDNQFDFTIKTMKRKGLAKDWHIFSGEAVETGRVVPSEKPVVTKSEEVRKDWPAVGYYEAFVNFAIEAITDNNYIQRVTRVTTVDLVSKSINQDSQINHFSKFMCGSVMGRANELMEKREGEFQIAVRVVADNEQNAPVWYLSGLSTK